MFDDLNFIGNFKQTRTLYKGKLYTLHNQKMSNLCLKVVELFSEQKLVQVESLLRT